jgi:hypothetical protein
MYACIYTWRFKGLIVFMYACVFSRLIHTKSFVAQIDFELYNVLLAVSEVRLM